MNSDGDVERDKEEDILGLIDDLKDLDVDENQFDELLDSNYTNEEVLGDFGSENGSKLETQIRDDEELDGVVPKSKNSSDHLRTSAPDTGEVAEIVLICTSLGSIRRQFFASKRAQAFLDCKAVVYNLIDVNKDNSTAKNLVDYTLFNDWKDKNSLMLEDCGSDVLIPQVLIDGVPIGDEESLQDLEEDGDLDWIFVRAVCPQCLHDKDFDAMTCKICGVSLSSLISSELVENGKVLQVFQGKLYNSAEYEKLQYENPFNSFIATSVQDTLTSNGVGAGGSKTSEELLELNDEILED